MSLYDTGVHDRLTFCRHLHLLVVPVYGDATRIAAAKELHVTTSALSHRIKALESELGVVLLKRTPQSVVLTPIGKQYYEQIAAGLIQLTSATNALHRAKGARLLRISSPPMLAARWLTLDAVEQGLGVGLARTLPVADALIQKRLVCPFGPALPISNNFHLVCPESSARNPEIVIFRDWVTAEARKSMASLKLPAAK